jgi:putative transposase
MPRTARLDIPDLLHHVIVRGVNREHIFLDDADRSRFCQRFFSLLTETGTECLAWSLMTNHVHLLLRPRTTQLSRFMRRLLTGYAVYFNRRNQRSGHLFQNRYKSIVCEEDTYLLELVRYIHLNPLRAGLVDTLDQLDGYPWCGHATLLGRQGPATQNTEEVLRYFGKGKTEARWKYRDFVADGVSLGRRDELVGIWPRSSEAEDADTLHDPRVLGGAAFVEGLRLWKQAEMVSPKTLPITTIIERVCTHFATDLDEIRSKTRAARVASIRSVICYLAVRQMGYSGTEVGRHLNLTRSAVSLSTARGESLVKDNPAIIRLLDI